MRARSLSARLHAFYSAPGQTFASVFSSPRSPATLGISPAAIGGLYLAGTVAAAVTLIFVGHLIDACGWSISARRSSSGWRVACFVTASVFSPFTLFAGVLSSPPHRAEPDDPRRGDRDGAHVRPRAGQGPRHHRAWPAAWADRLSALVRGRYRLDRLAVDLCADRRRRARRRAAADPMAAQRHRALPAIDTRRHQRARPAWRRPQRLLRARVTSGRRCRRRR